MDTQSWPWDLASRCLKTARQKTRARKKDYQKQLIALYTLRDDLWQQKRALPLVPLDEPYQKGWKRSFVLREDVARSGRAAFYEALLGKINTVMHAADKGFKRKKRRFRKRVYVDTPQYLRAFYDYEWFGSACRLTDEERAHFHLIAETRQKHVVLRYVFSEPWRYVLKVEPHLITHARLVDEVLEQRIAELDHYIERHNLSAAMNKEMWGSSRKWRRFDEKARYKDPLKNQPLHHILGRLAEDLVRNVD